MREARWSEHSLQPRDVRQAVRPGSDRLWWRMRRYQGRPSELWHLRNCLPRRYPSQRADLRGWNLQQGVPGAVRRMREGVRSGRAREDGEHLHELHHARRKAGPLRVPRHGLQRGDLWRRMCRHADGCKELRLVRPELRERDLRQRLLLGILGPLRVRRYACAEHGGPGVGRASHAVSTPLRASAAHLRRTDGTAYR